MTVRWVVYVHFTVAARPFFRMLNLESYPAVDSEPELTRQCSSAAEP